MNLPLSAILLLSAAVLAAPSAPGGPQSPDRHQMVAGWQIDDVADPREDDPHRRAIRMRREGQDWSVQYVFVESAMSAETRSHEVNFGPCYQSQDEPDWGGSATEQAQMARTSLLTSIAHATQSCDHATDIAPAAIDGFDQAFAAALVWDRERIAQIDPLRAEQMSREDAAADAPGLVGAQNSANVEMNTSMDDMTMDTNVADDTSMDTNMTMDPESNASAPPK